ncbi:MAG TPA: DUF6271 family protein, partial [Micromonosporaceae bacterium]|nr:DUF6271 family protein [Micromonosporaceae bacterium]
MTEGDDVARLLYIPTDRQCLPAIASGLREAAGMAAAHSPCHVAVIEHREAAYLREHAGLLREAASGPLGAAVLHVTPALWRAFLDAVLHRTALPEADRCRVRALFPSPTVAYGAGPNKAALLAASLAARFLHRRDSDQVPDVRDGQPCYPYVLEVAAAGRTVAETATRWPLRNGQPDQRHAAAPAAPAATVSLTGSGLVGDVSLDRRDLTDVAPELAAQVHALALPEVPLEQLRSRLHAKYQQGPQVRHAADFFELDTTGSTEMGNSCMVDRFLELPEMPAPETLATDYTVKNLLYQVGSPVLYHSRKMVHTYEQGRRVPTPLAAARYALRDLRYLILRRVRTDLNREVVASPGRFVDAGGVVDGPAFAARYAEHLDRLLPTLHEIPARYGAIYAQATACAAGDAAARLSAI